MNKLTKALKDTFIPYKNNGYKPHFFRELYVVALLLIIVTLFAVSAGTSLYIKKTNMISTVLPAVLADLTNDVRASNNEGILTRSSVLDTAARLKAEDMALRGYFAHNSPEGKTPWYWFNAAEYTFVYAGENLAIDFTESADVENAWLNSPGHRANILNARFTEIGIATKDGYYNGRPTTYVVQMFGTPAFAKKTAQVAVATTTKTVLKKTTIIKKATTTPVVATVTLVPSVKGEAIDLNQELETLTETKEFIAVKNNAVAEEQQVVMPVPPTHYSTWYERFLVKNSSYTDALFQALTIVLVIALALMIFVEIRHQHLKNILLGVLLLIVLISLMYINRNLFVLPFFL